MKKDILIVTGGDLNLDFAALWLKNNKYEYIIAADSGAGYAAALNVRTNVIIGDFDSASEDDINKASDTFTEIIKLPREKDLTDTEAAMRLAIDMKPDKITMLAATGTRLDHSLNNLFLMTQTLEAGIYCELVDKNNKIYLKNESFKIKKENLYANYISFIPLSEMAVISLKGFKYNLDKANIKRGSSLCQSNELEGGMGEVLIHEGIIAVFESGD